MQTGCADFAAYNFVDIFADSPHNWTKCCNGLTRCYQQCRVDKNVCDRGFHGCLSTMILLNPATAAKIKSPATLPGKSRF